ncbi:metal ABC transporter permease [Elusimicrobiota bacterium]
MFDLMLWPFLACLVLVGIHAYLGIHVIERGVIFVDLALAQIAALGGIIAILFGCDLHTTHAYLFSLGFTFLGATIFSLTRMRRKDVPQEAIIGVVYVVCAAASVLVLDRMPGEAEHIKTMLVGNILFVSPAEVVKVFVLYVLIGILHFFCRKKFIQISLYPERARAEGVSIRLWDFLFYVTFGFVVTSSVEVAGVLLVFSFLIMPAICAMLFTRDFATRLGVGWTLGAITSLAGIYFSAALDLPTGATVVCAFGFLVLLSSICRYFIGGKA